MRHPATWGMGCGVTVLIPVLISACSAQISGAPGDRVSPDAPVAPPAPPPIDGPVALGPWGTPATIPQAASTTSSEDDDTLSASALEMIFAVDGGTSGKDLFYTARKSVTEPWATAVPVPFNSAQSDETPRLSDDGLTLYFASGRAGNGNLDIWSVTRGALDNTSWGTPELQTDVSTTTLLEKWFMPCGAGHYVMIQGTATNGTDLVEGTRGGAAPTPITELNSAQSETGTLVSKDCLTIFFASNRPTSSSPARIYTSHRSSLTAAWDPPSVVSDFPIPGGNGSQEDPWLSEDGRTFVFASDAKGTKDIYISTR
ncbi:MAG TPA: hypothetical protein VFK02_10040 [Kofleriaceae bacterium]|nr:hypothetical protein [Kofleriaceae bacterium]